MILTIGCCWVKDLWVVDVEENNCLLGLPSEED